MSIRTIASGVALAASVVSLWSISVAGAANWLELNFYLSGPRYDGYLPACDEDWTLGRIRARFNEKENVYWTSGLGIRGFANIRETAYRPAPANSIPRRYCSAVIEVSDGAKRPLYYSISEGGGMFGSVYGVEWCIVGLDRNMAYGPNCRAARP
jgi:hypothetical protein